MKGKNIKILALAAVAVMTVTGVFAGCSFRNASTNVSSSAPSGSSATEEGVTAQVKLSFVNDAYKADGEDQRLIRGVDAEVKVPGEDETAEISALIELLETVPSDLENASTCVNDSFEIGNIDVNSGVAFVDIKSVKTDVNAETENFFIYQIADSVIASFDDISAVKFTVNGEEASSLAGYADISKALTKDAVDAFCNDGLTSTDPSDQSYLGRVDENGDILE